MVQRIGQPWVTPAPMTGIWKYAKVVGSVANIQLPPVKKYSVTFKESGLPLGTMWSVTLAGSQVFSLGKTITFLLQNGTYPFTIEPVSGYTPSPSSGNVNVSGKDVTVEVTFSPPAPSFDFSISSSETEVKVMQGGTTTVPISVQLTSGNPSNVSLSVGWIPEGSYQWFTTEFNPSSGNPPFSSTLTIKVKDSAPIGKYIAQIFATGGGKAKSVTVTVDIYPPTLIVMDYHVDPPNPTASELFNVTIEVMYDGPGSLLLPINLWIETYPEKDMHGDPFSYGCKLIKINGEPYTPSKEPVIPSGRITTLTY
ncbi:MAG: hypothetical protein ACPLGZ_03720, partial [Candidatus Pelagibacter ubique]